ncbi:MAG: hypothetical protein LBJ10_07450, partial [Clostridiales bacterium]|nr:hypothetical protein [Clostridiales bacterium]
RKIESVFNSFAGRYIRRIKLYGLWGGIFGLHFAVPAVSLAVAIVAKLIPKKARTQGRAS